MLTSFIILDKVCTFVVPQFSVCEMECLSSSVRSTRVNAHKGFQTVSSGYGKHLVSVN